MNSQFDEAARRLSDPGQADARTSSSAAAFYEPTPESVVTFTYNYEIPEHPRHFSFAHDPTRGLFTLTSPDGTTELFRDNAVRYLVVERDPQTGDLRPAAARYPSARGRRTGHGRRPGGFAGGSLGPDQPAQNGQRAGSAISTR